MNHLILSLFCLLYSTVVFGQPAIDAVPAVVSQVNRTSSAEEALKLLDSAAGLKKSTFWLNIEPAAFLSNLRLSVEKPASIYPGRETNFCGYGAISYLLVQDDPLGYVRMMLDLYQHAEANYGNVHFKPSALIYLAAGRLRFKGVLDIRPAEQLWYLVLADHFKGYLNFFNRRYDPGDENTMWAACNYAKFNRMARKLLRYQVRAYGSDLFRPSMHHTDEFIKKLSLEGTVILYLNNRILHKKKLDRIKLAIPTHYVVLTSIHREGNTLTMQYWDYGSRTQRQMTPQFFRKLVFGISYCSKKTDHE